jgi:hypothetical protein
MAAKLFSFDAKRREKAEAIAQALRALALAGPTATGATLVHRDGTTTYLSVGTARALYATGKQGGRADG